MIKQQLTILGYSLIGLLIGFCYLFPSSEYRSAQAIPVLCSWYGFGDPVVCGRLNCAC